MALYPVYPLWDIEPVKASGCTLWDNKGQKYLDLYGGHAVISIGHCHPHYVECLHRQASAIGFYSNSVRNSLQEQLAERLAWISGYTSYSLFLCNSGAEANENAIKLASFQNRRKRVLAFSHSFHGRSTGALQVTDNPALSSAFNFSDNVDFVPLNDSAALEKAFAGSEYAAAIIEGIQGVAGIFEPTPDFLQNLRRLCTESGTFLIADEVQSGCGRTGNYFAHTAGNVKADIISMAKGIANGFPMGAILIAPEFTPHYGQLGTTFGGNHLACAAALAVLDVIEDEHLMENAASKGKKLLQALQMIQKRYPQFITHLRGRGLMIGIELSPAASDLRNKLLFENHIFTGAAGKTVIRLLPPLCLQDRECDEFLQAFEQQLSKL